MCKRNEVIGPPADVVDDDVACYGKDKNKEARDKVTPQGDARTPLDPVSPVDQRAAKKEKWKHLLATSTIHVE